MNSLLTAEPVTAHDRNIDLVEEIRLRTWARRNYVVAGEREPSWHPIIRDEMARMDNEAFAV